MTNIDKCYKVYFDISVVPNIDKFIEKISSIGDIVLFRNDLYIWLFDNVNKQQLLSFLKKQKISEFFCNIIEPSDIQSDNNFNFISAWYIDHYNNYVIRLTEDQSQAELHKMNDNINRAKELLEKRQKQEHVGFEEKK